MLLTETADDKERTAGNGVASDRFDRYVSALDRHRAYASQI